MIIDGEQDSRAEVMPLEIMWRNPLCLVLAQLRLREASSLYYRWANKPERFAHVARIGTLIIAGQREYYGLSKSPSFSFWTLVSPLIAEFA
jgi:hypothetical protein